MIPLACTPALLIFSIASEALRFAPQTGVPVRTEVTLRHALVAQAVEFEGDDPGSQVSQHGLELTSEVRLAFEDTYRTIEDGMPTELRRVYADAGFDLQVLRTDATGRKIPEGWRAESPLREAGIVFVWVPEERDYGRHYDAKESLEEYLVGLREDVGFRCLLPQREVAPGDTWEIPAEGIPDLFSPGGNLPMAFTQGGRGYLGRAVAAGLGGPVAEVFGGEMQASAKAVWKDTREEDGARYAVVALDVEVGTTRDQTASARAATRRNELFEEITVDKSVVGWKFDGEGELVWNLTANRMESLHLGGREEFSLDIAYAHEGELTDQHKLRLAGSLEITASAKPGN